MSSEENRRLVIDFMEAVFNQQDFSQAHKYLAPNFIEHNANEKDGLEWFLESIPKLLAGTPKGSLDMVRSAAEGNIVWLHSKLPIHGKDFAFVDIFRMEGGKIVEHWDVLQPMETNTVSAHPYF